MNQNLNELNNIITQLDKKGKELNTIKATIREKEFQIKTNKLNLEFDKEFTEGLKVKEIPHKIHNYLLDDLDGLCLLKEQRDNLEHEYLILKLKINYLERVIDNQ